MSLQKPLLEKEIKNEGDKPTLGIILFISSTSVACAA